MTDKAKIRAFLEGMVSGKCCPQETKEIILSLIIPWIDSLPEEPVSSIWHDAGEEPKEGVDVLFQAGFTMYQAWYNANQKWFRLDYVKDQDGEDKIFNLYEVKRWCYLDDLLHRPEEPVPSSRDDGGV